MTKRTNPLLDILVIVDGDTAAGRGIVAGVADCARNHPDWHIHLNLNPLATGPFDSKADAVIYGTPRPGPLPQFIKANRPIVGCRAHAEPFGIPVVHVDNHAVGALAAAYFLERGFTRFVFDSSFDRSPAPMARWEGFRDAVREAGFDAVWRPAKASFGKGDPLAPSAIRSGNSPVAVLMGHDSIGRELAHGLVFRGIAIPYEVAILGVDDDELQCTIGQPPLSSISIPYEEIGCRAAETLHGLLSGKGAEPVSLVAPGTVRTRASTDIYCLDNSRLSKALQTLREHACDPIGVKELAIASGASRRWLEKVFRSRFGRSPFDAILQVRMEHARALLRDPRLSVKTIAVRCGYGHAQNFVSAFRNANGVTPKEYRRHLAP